METVLTAPALGGCASPPGRPPAKADLLDELHAGDSLKLGAKASATLVYYADCRKEVARGPNTLLIGAKASVAEAKTRVKSSEAPCELPERLTQEGIGAPGALVLMGPDGAKKAREKAEREYKQALEKKPDDLQSLLAYAAFCDNQVRSADAAELYQRALRLRPSSAALRGRVAQHGRK